MAERPQDARVEGEAPRLDDAGVLVTGASSGIGRAIAIAVARAGADVAITYHRNEAGACDTATEIERLGRRCAVLQLHLADSEAIARLPRVAAAGIGRLGVWINNAGADILTGDGSSADDVEKLDRLLEVDLRGTILASWAAAAYLREQAHGGVIINVSWDHALVGMAGRNPEMFAAVKGGVLSFSKSLARSLAPRVRVNVLAPGWVRTAFGESLDEARYRRVAEATPLGRWGTPDDVARAAVFLASADAAFLTGQTLLVNGGVVM